jgi:hypothetical protein
LIKHGHEVSGGGTGSCLASRLLQLINFSTFCGEWEWHNFRSHLSRLLRSAAQGDTRNGLRGSSALIAENRLIGSAADSPVIHGWSPRR